MKSSRGRWAQLGGLPGGGRLVVQGGQELREHGSGTGRHTPWGSIKTTKPVCRKLQPTNLQLQTTELQDSKDYRNYKLQNSKLQTCQLTNLQNFSSQPGAPRGLADDGKRNECEWTVVLCIDSRREYIKNFILKGGGV